MNKIDAKSQEYFLSFLERLSDIANPEFPGKHWVSNNGSECYADFDELYMGFMDACEVVLTWSELSKKQKSNLLTLYEMFEDYNEYLTHRKKTDEEIRNDPEWNKVREFAKQVYKDLKNVVYTSD